MNHYIAKFKKQGTLKYISHLDLIKVFLRGFKRGEIKLAFSQGFSPHPKLSFASPLPLGVTSIGEYMEFTLEESINPDFLAGILNQNLPKEIELMACKKVDLGKKTLAAMVYDSAYAFYFHLEDENFLALQQAVIQFMSQKEITIEKRQKKSKSLKTVDVKPFIRTYEFDEKQGSKLNLRLACGNVENLNPLKLLEVLKPFLVTSGIELKGVSIERVNLIDEKGKALDQLFK